MIKLIIGVIAVTIIGLVVFMAIDPSQKTTNTTETTIVSNSQEVAGKYSYTIEGEVNSAGTYSFDASTITMKDLISAAGGLTNSADDYSYYEDATLESGNTYFIASKYDNTNVCSLVEVTKVNINSDSAEALMKVSGFTTSVANSVVSYRSEKGEFKTVEDLLNVYGIGNATYRRVRGYVVLHE